MANEKNAVARPYAEAVLARAQETGQVDLWSYMLEFLSILVQTPEITRLIKSPKFSREQIEAALLSIVGDCFDAEGKNLLRILFKSHRLFLAPEIATLYERRKRELQGVLKAQVRSAFPLDAEQQQLLAEILKGRFQRNVEIHPESDASLIGGVVIRVGDLVIDGSVRGQLQRLSQQLRF